MQTYEQFADAAFLRILRQAPEMGARMGLAGLPQLAGLQGQLDDRSLAADYARRDLLDEIYAEHRKFAAASLTAAERLTFDVFDFFLRYVPFEPWAGVAGRDFVLHHYPVRHVWGAPADTFNTAANSHGVRNESDAEAFLERMTHFNGMARDLVEGLQHRDRLGLSPPRAAIAIVRAELEASCDVDESEMLTVFRHKLAESEIAEDRAWTLRLRAREIMQSYLASGHQELIACLRELEAKAAEPLGVWRLPRGDEFYQYVLTRETSTSMTTDEIYALGESEVARLHAELKSDAAALGFGGDDLAASLRAALHVEPNATVDTDAHREEILAYYSRLLEDASTKLRPFFNIYPRARCVVKPSPKHLEARRTTTYFPAASDGSYPGWLELCLLREIGKAPWARHQLAYHEAWPGHHLQLSIAQEATHLPLMRRTFVVAAFLEGWAKYAERLPFDVGVDTEPRYELQRKANELISASNLMLDTGIHARRWTRQQAVQFSMETAFVDRGMAEYLADRISVTPGQTTSYMIGLSEVRRLRAQMQKSTGEKFSLPAFHDRLLGEGALPLDVLRRRFE
jgi:uncharacterized protein (DUF885 family)